MLHNKLSTLLRSPTLSWPFVTIMLWELLGVTVLVWWIRSARRTDLQVRISLVDALKEQLKSAANLAITELMEAEERWANTFVAVKAPRLVEVEDLYVVSSSSYDRAFRFVTGHTASAVGIVGARGAGKSTLMRHLIANPKFECIGAHVVAPIHYSESEIVRLIHWKLTEALLSATSNNAKLGRRKSSGIDQLRLAPTLHDKILPASRWLLFIGVAAGLTLLWVGDQQNLSTLPDYGDAAHEVLAARSVGYTGLTALAGLGVLAGLLIAKIWRAFQAGARLRSSPRTLAGLAHQQLDWLKWTVNLEGTTKKSLKIGSVGLEGQGKLSRAERALTHADSVHALRHFMYRISQITRRKTPVIICVDELDKLNKGSDAVKVVNGLKDLFHVAGVHFLVSVSNDALLRFATRGVPLRDVFDSSFDTLIELKPLTFAESRDLIARRASDVPASAVLFCHAWSGGNARDLIRAARSCVQVLEEESLGDTTSELRLATVVDRVLTADLNEVLSAVLQRLRHKPAADDSFTEILAFKELLASGDGTLAEVLSAALTKSSLPGPSTGGSEAQLLASAIDPYMRIAALLATLFEADRSPRDWQSESMIVAVTEVAAARSGLGRHPAEIQRSINRAVKSCASIVGQSAVDQFSLRNSRPI
ncbi:P-loop NTPase fold protein [Cryptosporangium arvum]|nr:P-loop NTPase fold protein [Cryptosporangium arvum]